MGQLDKHNKHYCLRDEYTCPRRLARISEQNVHHNGLCAHTLQLPRPEGIGAELHIQPLVRRDQGCHRTRKDRGHHFCIDSAGRLCVGLHHCSQNTQRKQRNGRARCWGIVWHCSGIAAGSSGVPYLSRHLLAVAYEIRVAHAFAAVGVPPALRLQHAPCHADLSWYHRSFTVPLLLIVSPLWTAATPMSTAAVAAMLAVHHMLGIVFILIVAVALTYTGIFIVFEGFVFAPINWCRRLCRKYVCKDEGDDVQFWGAGCGWDGYYKRQKEAKLLLGFCPCRRGARRPSRSMDSRCGGRTRCTSPASSFRTKGGGASGR